MFIFFSWIKIFTKTVTLMRYAPKAMNTQLILDYYMRKDLRQAYSFFADNYNDE